MSENSLVEIGHIGFSYIKWNSRTTDKAVFKRLDRVVANPQWINIYRDSYVENLPIFGFDHGPILLSINNWHNKQVPFF